MNQLVQLKNKNGNVYPEIKSTQDLESLSIKNAPTSSNNAVRLQDLRNYFKTLKRTITTNDGGNFNLGLNANQLIILQINDFGDPHIYMPYCYEGTWCVHVMTSTGALATNYTVEIQITYINL